MVPTQMSKIQRMIKDFLRVAITWPTALEKERRSEKEIHPKEKMKSQNQLNWKGVTPSQSPNLQKTFATELAKAEELERQRMAQLLHDFLQPLLVGARYHLSCLRRQKGEQSQATIDRIDEILNESLSVSRSMTAELSPRILSEAGLLPAIKWLGEQYGTRHGLRVEVTGDGETGNDTEEIRTTMFQAAREVLLNVAKHAHATLVKMKLTRIQDKLVCVIDDDGVGFDPVKVQQTKNIVGGFGLAHLRERLALLGGNLKLQSAPGKGTRVIISCPVRASRPPRPLQEM